MSDHPGHPVDRAEADAGTVADPTAGFSSNVGTAITTPTSGQTDRATWIGMPDERPPRLGFFTDTSVCIGCKACEVACKEWNLVPADAGPTGSGSTRMADLDLLGMSYDNTGHLGASTWRHVAFVESHHSSGPQKGDVRWLMASDVCKHCTHAACLDVCPTGALMRTEFDTVYVQPDVCNGCGYCVPACPYGVIDIRPDDGRAFKCTLCYDRTKDGLTPACAQACPTESIQFGPLDELRERADRRLEQLHVAGVAEAQLYGRDPDDGVGGDGAFFLLLDEPEVYGLPPDPVVTTRDLPAMWKRAALAAAGLAAAVAASFLGRS
ncbi:formate dehydrogenase beta subunit [Pseudonocardia cypriaca]|uniref:Formate dehydrogenase beta subunit n=2 Tax=Pseudonocardia cypriaca TaxID=882449 RepID=A0A543FWW1_9PSEU|nr:formate dehydrogenase beta subunit [Pseudonocardia cypriaca]